MALIYDVFRYVTRALADHPTFFKGMAVIDPSLGGPDGCEWLTAHLERVGAGGAGERAY